MAENASMRVFYYIYFMDITDRGWKGLLTAEQKSKERGGIKPSPLH